MAAAVVVVSGGLASVATGASAATVKSHTPKCFGKTATIVVTGNNKTVRAPKGRQHKAGSVIVALGRGDKVYGGDGNDKICVGNAKLVNAGKGDDDVQFTTGTIHGNDGNDLLQQVGKGNATVYGDAGNDKIKLAKGNSTAHGGDGNDSLSVGASGTQKLYGDAGNDNFYAGGATATLDGGVGDDNYTVSGFSAPHTFVVPGTGDKVNGQYVRVDALKDASQAVLTFNGLSSPAYATTELPGDVVDADRDALQISNAIAPVGRTLVAWSINFGDGSPVVTGHGAPPSSYNHNYIGDGAHGITVSVTDSAGNTSLHGITVYAAKAPTSTLTHTVTGSTATFTTTAAADAGNSAISTYNLDFGDGTNVSGAGAPPASLTHAYAPGNFDATLTVIDDHGAQSSAYDYNIAVGNTNTGNPSATVFVTKQVALTGSVARTSSFISAGGAGAQTVELGQPFNYRTVVSETQIPNGYYNVTSETIDLGDGRGPKAVPTGFGKPVASDATVNADGYASYNTPGVKTITLSATETGTDFNGNALPPRTVTATNQVNVLGGVTTAQLSAFSGTEGSFTAYTAGTAPAPGTSIAFYELTGPNGYDVYGVGAPPAALSQALTTVNGAFTLTVRDSLGYTATTTSRGVVTADHPAVSDPSFSGTSGWAGQALGVGPDDTTTGGFVSAGLVPSFGSRITGTLINYGDGTTVVNAPGSLSGSLSSPTAHVYRAPGDYTVTVSVTDSSKKTASATVLVSVAGKPTLAVASTNAPATNTPATFSVAAGYGGAGAQAWEINYSDGTPGAGGFGPVPATFAHTFTTMGSHEVTVEITNDHGGSISDAADVTTS